MREITTSSLNFLYRLSGVVGGIAALFILIVAIVGIKGCVTNDRNHRAACAEVGGRIYLQNCVIMESVPTENWRK